MKITLILMMVFLIGLDHMFELANTFANLIQRSIPRLSRFPIKTDIFIHDSRFTPEWLIEHIREQVKGEDDELWRDGGHCYQHLIDEMEYVRGSRGYMIHVCDSDEIGESWLCGDYSYYYGFVNPAVPFLYHQSSHGLEYPNRLVFYGKEFQIEVITDSIYIQIFEVVPNVRNLFFINNDKMRVWNIKDFLANTDRPLVDMCFNKK